MTLAEYKEHIKKFFEQYYEKLSQDDDNIKRPLGEKNRIMWTDDADADKEWKKWKLVPAKIDENEIEDLEQEIGVKLPSCINAFLTVYHHFFENPIGVNPVSEHFKGMKNAWNPILVKHGYLPFSWDRELYYIRCMQLANMPTEEKCGIYQISHEKLFDVDEETVTQDEIDECMEFVSENLLTYLDEVLNSEDSLYDKMMNEVLDVLYDEFNIEDFETFEIKMEEDSDCIYDALKPIIDEYELSEEDVDDIFNDIEYWF